jgi:hypothetical protein
MSVCERCWSDAAGDVAHYEALLDARRSQPCSPEQQAGPNAAQCPGCGSQTIHQHTGEPMCGCPAVDAA